MLSIDFEPYFEKYKELYMGCFSSDNYPETFSANYQFFIFNKEPSHLGGSHWFAVLLNNNVVEFFDSAGTNEKTVQQLLKFRKQYHCEFNESPLQPYDSSSCGEFCVFFVLKRLNDPDISLSRFLNMHFSNNLLQNDKKVKDFCKE